ncbi:unnamed protein product, partial [Laminaria digitata]
VPTSKANWEARSVPEYVNNYKVLQSALDSLHIDVKRLTRGKYMDNLEFIGLRTFATQRGRRAGTTLSSGAEK